MSDGEYTDQAAQAIEGLALSLLEREHGMFQRRGVTDGLVRVATALDDEGSSVAHALYCIANELARIASAMESNQDRDPASGQVSQRPVASADAPRGPAPDSMTLYHADGTPYMDVRDYHARRGDPPRLRYDSNQDSERDK